MRCRDIDALIIGYAEGAAVPPEASAHIAGCERCRRLAQALGKPGEVPTPAPERLQRIEASILADLRPVKPLPSPGVLSLSVLVALGVVAAAGGLILGTAGWHALGLLQKTAVFAALAAAAALLALSIGRQLVPGAKVLLSPAVLVFAALAAITAVVVSLFHPRPEATFVPTGLVCLRIGLECALAASVLFWLALRRGAALDPLAIGATAGTLAGLTGFTVLEIFCPNLNELHVLVWHFGAVLASAVAGFAVGLIAGRAH